MRESISQLAAAHPDAMDLLVSDFSEIANELLTQNDVFGMERYLAGVGIAFGLVVTKMDYKADLSPLRATMPNVAYYGGNRDKYPKAWESKPMDESVLGGTSGIAEGRSIHFALGKLNTMAVYQRSTSFVDNADVLLPGCVGLAGGIRWNGDALALSGMDHVDDNIFAREVPPEIIIACVNPRQRSVDRLADRLRRRRFDNYKRLSPALDTYGSYEKIPRNVVGELLRLTAA